MAYGIGTDDVGGTVNFYDGTTTVIPMAVDIKYRDYYLMDTDANGKDLTTTSCLRTPTNTFVYGGSHCMMRACEDVTSKGGAPTRNGNPLGIYKYPKIKAAVEAGQTAPRCGFGEPNGVGLVKPTDIPADYQAESVTPNTNGTADTSDDYLNFWFTTEEESSVKPEVDKKINFWKACMTEISAEYMSYGGTVGGETMILPNEENKYLLYCQIDENISNVISAGTGFGEDRVYSYKAPVKDPTSGQLGQDYLYIPPSYVGEEYQNYIETVDKEDNTVITGEGYTITEKIYYVVPTTADTWMTFTAPFNVEKLYIVEAYEEAKLAATPLKEVTDEDGNTTIYPEGECHTSLEAMLKRNPAENCTVVARKELVMRYYEEIRPEEHPEWLTDDLPMWLWFAANSRYMAIDCPMSVHRVLKYSVSHNPDYRKKIAFVDSLSDISIWYDERYNGGRLSPELRLAKHNTALWVLSYNGSIVEYIRRWQSDVKEYAPLKRNKASYGLFVKKVCWRMWKRRSR